MIHNGSNVEYEYEYEYLMNGARGVARGGLPSPPPPSLGGPPVCITVSSVSAVVRCCVVVCWCGWESIGPPVLEWVYKLHLLSSSICKLGLILLLTGLKIYMLCLKTEETGEQPAVPFRLKSKTSHVSVRQSNFVVYNILKIQQWTLNWPSVTDNVNR